MKQSQLDSSFDFYFLYFSIRFVTFKEIREWRNPTSIGFHVSGSGVLAVPYAFGLINYWALLLLFLVVGLTAFTACLIGNLEAHMVKGPG